MVETHSKRLSPFGPALQFGGGSNEIPPSSFWIRLAEVVSAGRLDATRWMLERGADVHAVDLNGCTALHALVARSHERHGMHTIAKELLKAEKWEKRKQGGGKLQQCK